jgi:protein-S-isoprenylcysteine O-methyltransferase Ste14
LRKREAPDTRLVVEPRILGHVGELRRIRVSGFAFCVFWLSWMFISLGDNLTDTVVTRECAHFVESGPYRFVRDPMYTGVLLPGLALGTRVGRFFPRRAR